MLTAFIGLGSNLGDRVQHIRLALARLNHLPAIRLAQVSGLYETEPVGMVEQPDFLNAIARVEFEMLPGRLLLYLQDIEIKLGRVRDIKWGPRTIDLDVLAISAFDCLTDILVLPHPELARRKFVLVPFNEIAPHFVVPGLNRSVSSLLSESHDESRVRSFMTSNAVWKMPKEDSSATAKVYLH